MLLYDWFNDIGSTALIFCFVFVVWYLVEGKNHAGSVEKQAWYKAVNETRACHPDWTYEQITQHLNESGIHMREF